VDFVKQVAISDMFEIQSNKLAQENEAGEEKDEAFAAQMVTDHTKNCTELKALVSSGKAAAEVPTALDSSHQSKLDKLKGLSDNDFVSCYRSMQVTHIKMRLISLNDMQEAAIMPNLRVGLLRPFSHSNVISRWLKVSKGRIVDKAIFQSR
jgi:predicted outer membrane protein